MIKEIDLADGRENFTYAKDHTNLTNESFQSYEILMQTFQDLSNHDRLFAEAIKEIQDIRFPNFFRQFNTCLDDFSNFF